MFRSWFSLSSALQKGWKIVTFKSLCPSLDTSENCARPSIISFFDARYFYDLHSPNPHSMNFSQVTLESWNRKLKWNFLKMILLHNSFKFFDVKSIMDNFRKKSPSTTKKCQISNLRSIWQLITVLQLWFEFVYISAEKFLASVCASAFKIWKNQDSSKSNLSYVLVSCLTRWRSNFQIYC